MARDLRVLSGRNKYPDKCYFYDSTAVENNTLVKDAQPLGRFYKKDVKPFQWEYATINGIVSSNLQFIGIIETVDVVNIKPDMYVKDNNGDLFIVVAPVISDDMNRGKVVGTRPQVKSTLTLRGLKE